MHAGAGAANHPAFLFPGQLDLNIETKVAGSEVLSAAVPEGQLSLTAPADRADKPHLPVRGDLAHIGLAGRYFVPHYAVPMPRRVATAATLRSAGSDAGEALRDVSADAVFDVLDISGGWAWGQMADDGLVGYLPLSVLDAA